MDAVNMQRAQQVHVKIPLIIAIVTISVIRVAIVVVTLLMLDAFVSVNLQ